MQQLGMVDKVRLELIDVERADETAQNRQPIEGPNSEWRKIECGASTYVVAAFDPSIAHHNGSYLVDCAVHDELAKDYVKDPANVDRLWKLSEELIAGKV